MAVRHNATFCLIVLTAWLSIAAAKQTPRNGDYKIAPGEIVVKFKKISALDEQSAQASATLQLQSTFGLAVPQPVFPVRDAKQTDENENLSRIYLFSVPSPTDIASLASRIANDPSVEYAEPHYYFRINAIPNDPLYPQLYPLHVVKGDSAWSIQQGDSSVIIGIIDSGVDWDHPDLSANIWNNADEIAGNGLDDDANGYIDDVRGWDFVASVGDAATSEDGTTEDNDPMDFDGHGTHVSGIAAGTTNNGLGISSLGWGCRIMPLRSGWHSTDGNGYVSSLYASKAYVYAADNGASVCNQSSGTSEVVLDGAKYAFKHGVVIVNSAGNSNTDVAAPLGSEPWALSVASTNSADGKASYSTYHASVDISAPGGDFSSGNRKGYISTVVNPSSFYNNELYAEFQGTSMSSPLVAALAGLIKSKNKGWGPAEVMFQITGTADNIDALNPAYAGKLGFGRLNALRALQEMPPAPKPDLDFITFSVNDNSGGNNNGIIEAGENVALSIELRNSWGTAENLQATLSTNHWSVAVTKTGASFGTLYGIVNLDSNQRGNLADPFTIAVGADALPEIIPFTLICTADGGYSKEFHFEISLGARILVVDDDDGTVNVEQFYFSALQSIGAAYDHWDHGKKGTPPLSVLQQYSAVLWSCEWAFPSLDSADRAVIASFLDGGGRLFLSGQDIGWDLCDAGGIDVPNELGKSGGASKTFFEQYLKAKYLSDDAGTENISGIPSDTIGNLLTFTRYQPMRASTEQYPDVIEALNGSVHSFVYPDGASANKGAAVLYSGSYKLLFFSFGGFESISDSSTRLLVKERILKWLFEYDQSTDRLSNTENTSMPYTVHAVIHSKSVIQSANLYWDNDGQLPYKTESMTFGNGKYTAAIPAQSNNSTVKYFVLAKTADGYLPYTQQSFFVGVDTIKPVVTVTDTIRHSIDCDGPYSFTASFSDDIGIDSTSAKICYRINEGSEQTVQMVKVAGKTYSGAIVPPAALKSGDIVTYYVSVNDVSQLKNVSRFPTSGHKQFSIGREVVDNFENPDDGKWEKGLWNHTPKQKFNGTYSFTDSPDSSYPANTDRSALLLKGYDLSPFSKGALVFHQKFNIHTTDTAYVELSGNNIDWIPLKKFTGINLFWKKEQLDIAQFTGGANTDVRLRLRLKSDGAGQSDGIYIDNIEILTDDFTVTSVQPGNSIPQSYSLTQNYPNPFNPATTIRFEIPSDGFVTLKLFDIIGRETATLVNEHKSAGVYHVTFDASALSSGVYFYRLKSGSFSALKKMIVVK